ncbi:hypothetical protein EJ05DRAFT_158140 [Pseudovirgaria hyperparasitica]|uniref:Uncharacterized protein n=1 Tax=Pseudovirgaria hyperparasitica TaxID=470096 RepID=A0A6A6VW06_9PEZI|nr:uncharacterized protein EJ05DRAFT_158140 [Pseudovirgaria hyperparasitica]KAF2753894.1 hypothetical protein EJ05DRAFT_158140 [Pseudovirgaria hyperparasitica]
MYLSRTMGVRVQSHTCQLRMLILYSPPVAGRLNATYDLGASVPHMRSLGVSFRANDYADSVLTCMRGVATPDIGHYATSILKWGSIAVPVFASLCSILIRMRQRHDNENLLDGPTVPDDPAEAFIPGVIDCLQYLQFVFLTGCITLKFPGFFRPVVGQFAWSTLMTFHPITTHFVYDGIEDGIYAINATYGFEEMAQVLGAPTMSDLWLSVVINLAIAMAAVGLVMVVTYLIRGGMRRTKAASRQERKETWLFKTKNVGWNLLRVAFNWFLQPILAFCTFQLLVVHYLSQSKIAILAVILTLLAVSLAFMLYRIIFQKRGYVFMNDSTEDRLSLSFSINARLALLHYFVLIVRGVAFGALQISGRGQIICLAAVEAIALIAFLIFQHSSGYTIHTYSAGIRLCIILLFITFLNGVHASTPVKGWVAYIILGLHFCIILAAFVIRPTINVYKELAHPKSARVRAGHNKRPTSEGPAVLGLHDLGRRPDRDGHFPGDGVWPDGDNSYTRASPVLGQRYSRPARSASALSGTMPLTATSPTIADRRSHDTISPVPSWTEDDARTYTTMSTSDQFAADKDYATREADSYFGNPVPQHDTDNRHSLDESEAHQASEPRPIVSTLRNLGNRFARGRSTRSGAGFEVSRPQRPPPAFEVVRPSRVPEESSEVLLGSELRRRPSQTPQAEDHT